MITHINEQRAEALLSYLHRGLVAVANARTSRTLGNRSAYIGASDLAKARSCFRQAVLDKLAPVHSHSLSELLMFERGHWQEDGIKAALDANRAKVIHQLEIEFTTPAGNLCRFHLDLVLVTQTTTHVLESKSFREEPPSTPYDSHFAQIRMQIEALSRHWNQPAFRIAGSGAELVTFPELVASHVKSPVKIQKNIEGRLICVGADKPQPFGPYFPEGDNFWQGVMSFADRFAQAVAMQSSNLQFARGIYPLCDYCAHDNSCPKFKGQAAEQFADAVSELNELQIRIKALEAQETLKKDALKHAYRQLQPNFAENEKYVLTSSGKFCLNSEERRSIKHEKLVSVLTAKGLSETEIKAILVEATTVSKYEKFMLFVPKRALAKTNQTQPLAQSA